MFTAPTPSPVNLGAEERPVRAALSSALEEALLTPPSRPQAGLMFIPVSPHIQPSCSLFTSGYTILGMSQSLHFLTCKCGLSLSQPHRVVCEG